MPKKKLTKCKISNGTDQKWVIFKDTDEGLRVFYKELWAYGTFRVKARHLRRLSNWLNKYIEALDETKDQTDRKWQND